MKTEQVLDDERSGKTDLENLLAALENGRSVVLCSREQKMPIYDLLLNNTPGVEFQLEGREKKHSSPPPAIIFRAANKYSK